jgi:hypothetical protein
MMTNVTLNCNHAMVFIIVHKIRTSCGLSVRPESDNNVGFQYQFLKQLLFKTKLKHICFVCEDISDRKDRVGR